MAKKMRALVSGASGFIGSHLVEALLKRDFIVFALLRDPRYLEAISHPDLYLWYGDITDKGSLNHLFGKMQFEYIYHLAGLTKASSEEEFMRVNCDATANLIKLVQDTQEKLNRFVFFSSHAAVGPREDDKPKKEDDEAKPLSPYGRSKLAAEKLFDEYPFPYTIIRPPSVYGPREKDIFTFFKIANKFGITPILAGEMRQISLIHVFDLIEGSIQAGFSDSTIGSSYFLSDGECHTWLNFASATEAALGRKLRILTVPSFGVHLIGEIGEYIGKWQKKMGVINREKVNEMLALNWTCSDEAARKDFGYNPKIHLKEGIKQTIDWYKEAGWL